MRDKLIEVYGAETRALGRAAGLHDDHARATSASPRRRSADTLDEPDDPAAALISISPRTGAIRAMAAVVPNRPKNQFNLLSQARRQPGSTFKTFVLAAAVEQGINPDSTVLRLGALHVQGAPGRQLRRRHLVVRQDLRQRLLRVELDSQRDDSL